MSDTRQSGKGAPPDMDESLSAVRLMLSNGPNEIGIAAGKDDYEHNVCKLPRNLDMQNIRTALYMNPDVSDKAGHLVVIAAMVLILKPDWKEANCERDIVSNHGGKVIKTLWTECTEELLRDMKGLVVACKIQWYQTNHHTGTDCKRALGYASKVMAAVGLNPDAAGDVSAVHMFTHWYNTAVVLSALGVTGLKKNLSDFMINSGNDVTLRGRSNPAGTAKAVDVITLISAVIQSEYISLMTPGMVDEYLQLLHWKEEAQAHWMDYHVGCKFITGRPSVPTPTVSDGLAAIAKAYALYALSSKSWERAHSLGSTDVSMGLKAKFTAIARAVKNTTNIGAHSILTSYYRAKVEGDDMAAKEALTEYQSYLSDVVKNTRAARVAEDDE